MANKACQRHRARAALANKGVYVRLGNWMITDRHYVFKVNWEVTDLNGHPQYVRKWHKASERRLDKVNATPVQNVQGSWTLTPTDNGRRTRVTYISHLDLGGSVPASIFSRGFVSKAYDILKKYSEQHIIVRENWRG